MSYHYYAKQNILPTFADLKNEGSLDDYEKIRERMFFRLKFLPEMFHGKTLLECGPDSGENALVFDRWGVKLTLIEPNILAHNVIRRNFHTFTKSTPKIFADSILTFSGAPFDIVCAEGFIYTIPMESWIEKLTTLVKSKGFVIISYLEKHGCNIELLTKKIYKQVAKDLGSGVHTAKLLFGPKWDTIHHTRSFESWFMDVIENPFVDEKYLIDYRELLSRMKAFRLYSSWPNYLITDEWIKSEFLEQKFLEIKEEVVNLPTKDLVSFCREDWFMNHWGTPNHYAIFQKL